MKVRANGGAPVRARRWTVALVVTLLALGLFAAASLAARIVVHESGPGTAAAPTTVLESATPTVTATASVAATGTPLVAPAPPPPEPSSAGPDVGTPLPTALATATAPAGPTFTVGPTLTPTPLPPPPTAVGPLREEEAVEVPGTGPPGPLSGVATDSRRVVLRPIAVTIDNYSPSARPQIGLGQASLVYETVAEYGITRFMAVYLEKEARVVGPVRSTRVYYNEWANGLNAMIVHAGGNSDALPQLGRLHGIQDVNEIGQEMYRWQGSGGPLFFWRSPDRYAPYNLYTSISAVRAQVARHHFAVRGHYPVDLPHKGNAPPEQRPASAWLTISFSSFPYAVQYRYNPSSNRYKRFMAGVPHVDAGDGRQLAPRNVAVIFCGVRPDPSSTTPYSVIVSTTGGGKALLFQDGRVQRGLWHREGLGGPLQLTSLTGTPWRFNPGQTWIEAVPSGNPVSWSPWSGR